MKIKRNILLLLMLSLVLTACESKEEPKEEEVATVEEPAEETPVTTEEKTEETDEEAEKQYVEDFDMTLLDGSTLKLSEIEEELIVLNYWATWCGPCKFEMPDLQKLSEDFDGKVKIIAMNAGEETEDVQKYIDENGFNFTVALDQDNSTPFFVQALPTTFIIGKDMEVIGMQTGLPRVQPYDFYAEVFNELLAEKTE